MENKTAESPQEVLNRLYNTDEHKIADLPCHSTLDLVLDAMESYALQQTDSIRKELEMYREKYTCNQHTVVNLQSSLNEASKLVELAFNESRLTHPMIGFKHKDFAEFLSNTKDK